MARIKVLSRNAVVAWSPRSMGNDRNYLAAATSAQQMDASFSCDAQLEIADVNTDAFDLRPKFKVDVKNR